MMMSSKSSRMHNVDICHWTFLRVRHVFKINLELMIGSYMRSGCCLTKSLSLRLKKIVADSDN